MIFAPSLKALQKVSQSVRTLTSRWVSIPFKKTTEPGQIDHLLR